MIIYLSVICLAGGILHMLGTLLVRLISHSLTKITKYTMRLFDTNMGSGIQQLEVEL